MPHPFAGEPIITAAIPPLEELSTASTTTPEEEVAEESSGEDEAAGIQIEAPVEQDSYQTEASIILSPRRPLKPAPVAVRGKPVSVNCPASSATKASDVYARNPPCASFF